MAGHLEYIISKLQASKGRWPAVAEGSGVSIRTFEKIARRVTKDPRSGTVDKLTRYFRELENRDPS